MNNGLTVPTLKLRSAGETSAPITSIHGIDIGKQSPAVPVTSPYVRVRIRRFGGLSYRHAVKRGIPSEVK
jgi:hypothetical protein